jgi:hypothetical protein
VSWIGHALTTSPLELPNANIFWPDRLALYYGPSPFGVVPYALPAFLATGSAAAGTNTALLVSAALTALALHGVVWRWTGSAAAGFVAAWTLLVNRYYIWGFVPTTPHLTTIQYFPLIVYLAAGPLQGWWRPLALLALVAAQCLSDPVYVGPAVVAPLGVLALSRLARRPWRQSGWRLLGVLALLPLALAPFLAGYLRVRLANPALRSQTPWAGATALLAVEPTHLNSLFWRTSTPLAVPTTVGLIVVGLIAAGGLAGVLCWRRGIGSGLGRRWAHAGFWVVVGTFIALSPVVVADLPWLDGTWTRTRIALPQHWLAVHTELYRVVRVPARLGVAALMGLCLLAGLAVAELMRAAARGGRALAAPAARAGLAVALAALVYVIPPAGEDPLPDAYPTRVVPTVAPELLRQLRSEDGPLLELPAVFPTSVDRLDAAQRADSPTHVLAYQLNAAAMYRSTLHWRPLVNGYASYWPAGFIDRARATDALPALDALRQLVCQTGVRTILVNLRHFPPERRAVWLRAATEPTTGLQLVGEWPEQLLFDVTLPRAGEPGGPSCPGAGERRGDGPS